MSEATPLRRISPTDISQFIRLGQCRRYLALRLKERSEGLRFLYDEGVQPQSIPPLLTRSGARFEQAVEEAVTRRYPVVNCAAGSAQPNRRTADNDLIADYARTLPPGQTLCLFQARLIISVGTWQLRGDADIIRLERSALGDLNVLIADMKSSTSARTEHRVQVAFYQIMLNRLFELESIPFAAIKMAILYHGESKPPEGLSEQERQLLAEQQAAASAYFGVDNALLELIADQQAYLDTVYDLVTGPDALATQIAQTAVEETPYSLDLKCDGCLYNELCLKQSAKRDDLSLLPHLSLIEKDALQRGGIRTVHELALLKDLDRQQKLLSPAAGKEELIHTLATTWPVGPRLDELIHRARLYRQWKGDDQVSTALSYIPSRGHNSLPYCDANHNPNLVRVYIDVQHDYLQNRLYLLGAMVVAYEQGEAKPQRRRNVVAISDGPPADHAAEEHLLVDWIRRTLQAVVELAAPDERGQAQAPIHLIFYERFGQRALLDGLARHLGRVFAATPLYDLLTQLAAFDSPAISYLEDDIRVFKNYPMLCQSLQQVAAYLKFDWTWPQNFRQIFRTRMFDFWSKLDPEMPGGTASWYTGRARFNSQIPLEYAYVAWGEVPPEGAERLQSYAQVSVDLLLGFQKRRLEALEHIAGDFKGNDLTTKTSFKLPALDSFHEKARTLADALYEFVMIERHVELAAWKMARNKAPEQRVLMGETLLTRFYDSDQEPDSADQNHENRRRYRLGLDYRRTNEQEHPGEQTHLTPEQQNETRFTMEGMTVRLRFDTTGLDCNLDEMLSLSTLREGESVIVYSRTATDERLPAEQQVEFTPTPKQMLYGTRGVIASITIERDDLQRAFAGTVELKILNTHGGNWSHGFVFNSIDKPFNDNTCYTLDPDPNSWYGYWCLKISQDLCKLENGQLGGQNTLYERLAHPELAQCIWNEAAAAGQARFLAGLQAMQAVGALHDFEPDKCDYIGKYGDRPVLLVQGPPGTGKSYSTAFALFARIQGALAADKAYRAVLACKTHAATDVLLENTRYVQMLLRTLRDREPAIFARFFDERLLEVPLFRVAARNDYPDRTTLDGITYLIKDSAKTRGQTSNVQIIREQPVAIIATTPGGIYGMVKAKNKNLFAVPFCDCLILDEASQMNIPEAIMAALPLTPDGQLIVVGDHRQMPPIVKHDWDTERRRTFQEYKTYESLFNTLRVLYPPPQMVKFAESFRLHAAMAEFLREEIYRQDGIPYFSRRHDILPERSLADSFVASVLSPTHPIVIVVHDEAHSQMHNQYEQQLIAPILSALAGDYELDWLQGLGIVVPHRMQRAEMQAAFPYLSAFDAVSGVLRDSAIDTVERFQGGERTCIVVSATESDPAYLLVAGEFLLDPCRLTVALSRAKRKLILVASRSIFTMFSPDEEVFANAQLWKDLLRHTCKVKLWDGKRDGHQVEVWGNGDAAGD